MLIPKNVAPSGFPSRRKVIRLLLPESLPGSASEVLSRNSCVTAMPMDANARDVRSQARKVRSSQMKRVRVSLETGLHEVRELLYPVEGLK
jgi:hypothetical protein